MARENLPDPDRVPPAIVGLDIVLAVVIAATLLVLASGVARRHVAGALAVATGLAIIVVVARLIVRNERRADR